jgi:hypothetical protein
MSVKVVVAWALVVESAATPVSAGIPAGDATTPRDLGRII